MLEYVVMAAQTGRARNESTEASASGRGEPPPLVAYVRVSTQQQAEQGMGLDVQRAEIEAWADREGHRIGRWESDEGVSGSNGLDTRIGLFNAMQAIEDDQAGGLVVYRLDRLARALVLQETVLSRVWQHGGSVHSTVASENELLDPTRSADDDSGDGDPSRTMLRQILGAVAEYERAMIRLRLRSGKLAKRAKGGYVGGKVPFGYELDGEGGLAPVEQEQAAIARMRELRAGGVTLQGICDALTAEGHVTKHGGRWQTATVGGILRRVERNV